MVSSSKRSSFRSYYLSLLWILVMEQVLLKSLAECNEHPRRIRSLKDALPKDDDYSKSRSLMQLRHKVFNLENSVNTMNTEIEKITSQNAKVQSSVDEQKGMLENLESQFTSLQLILSTHAETLGDLEKISSPGENLFALSNQTCGGILVGQSGSIVFSNSAALRGTRHPSNCIWTVRANNRQSIKISTHLSFRSSYLYSSRTNTYVVEIVKNNATGSGSSPFKTRSTKLEKNMHHIFDGPVVFIVYSLGTTSDDFVDADLHLQFEGLGKLTEKSTYFSHQALFDNSGNFSDSEVVSWSPSILDILPEKSNYTLDYTTIVVSNFSTKVHLQAAIENGTCPEGVSFIAITDVLENNTNIRDCCKSNCQGRNSLINYDNPYLILILKKFQQPVKFNLTWVAETPYPSSSKPVLGYKCGEVLGGVSGTLSYKPHASYRNGERCIWVIVPQPRPRSSIVLNVGTNGVENTYDHLYMMELTNSSGTTRSTGPKITRLGRYGNYEAHSREVYIVFYSDSSVTGYGFSISWRSSGVVVKSGKDVTTHFTILRDDDGSATSLELKPPQTNDVYQVFLLTPVVPYSYIFGMQLHINQTYPVARPNDCLHEDITVFTALDGILNTTHVECTDPGQAMIENADGMAMIVLNKKDSNSNVTMSFSWREEYGEGNTTYVVVENGQCGGVIRGDRGVLKYKIGVDYFNNERCVWLLHSPNSTNITLKLVKDGFEACCDYLLVTTIDPSNGTLRNDTVPMNRSNRTRTFQESLLVIVFRSDPSTRGRGFALQFIGDGEGSGASDYRYQLRHHNEPFGGIVYPSSEWEDPIPGKKEIFVIASSLKIGLDEDPLVMPSNISWTSGVFKKEIGACNYDSITFYTTPDPDGWVKRERFPYENETSLCSAEEIVIPKKDDICSTVFSTFLVVYKPVVAEDPDDDEAVLRMGFTFKKSAGCGGVIIGESGEISYKEDGKYTNMEKCVWLVEAPQASKIRFRLERSGFEECCDLLIIHTIDRNSGIPYQAAAISQGNRTASVDGPVAAIIFSSDSSVVGDGFRLSFSTETTTTEDFRFTYHLEHANQPNHNSFVYQVESSQMIIVAYSPEIHRQTYQGTGKTQINIQSFRPQVNENCTSDSLIVYDVMGRDRELVAAKSFSVFDVLKGDSSYLDATHGNCSALEDRNYKPCENILDCGDDPAEDDIFYTNTTSFLAVYRGVNRTSDLRFRGFVMVSVTTFSTS